MPPYLSAPAREGTERGPAASEEAAGGQGEIPHIGNLLHGGPRTIRPFLVQAAGQRGKAFGFEDLAHGGRAQGDISLFENFADLVNRVILLTKRSDQVSSSRLFGLGAWPGAGSYEEARLGIAAESVTEDAEGARRITKGLGGFGGSTALDVIRPKRLVLALLGMLGLQEESAGMC